MADVRRAGTDGATHPDDGRERGQMLLVAAFGVAVMLVVLALILNTAIYTENIATRGSDISGGKDAARYTAATERALDGAVESVNYENPPGYTELERDLRWSVWNYSNMSGMNQAKEGVVTDLDILSVERGTRVYRDTDGNFTSDDAGGGERNWTVVSGTSGVRNVTLDVDEMKEYDPGTVGPSNTNTDVFYVNFTANASDQYRVYVFNDSNTDDAVVQVYDESETLVGQCTAGYDDRNRVVVDFTAATVNGSDCSYLEELATVSGTPYDVSFNNTRNDSGTDTVVGQYSLVTDLGYTDGGVNAATGTPYPDKDYAVYSVTVQLEYESKRLLLETEIRSAPGEFDD